MQKRFKVKITKKKIIACFLLFIIIVIGIVYYYKVTIPFVNTLADETVKDEAINAIAKSNSTLQKMSCFYEDLFEFVKNNDGDIVYIKSNTSLINQINMIAYSEIQKNLEEIRENEITIPTGAFTGSVVFASIGSKIRLKVVSIGNCSTTFKSQFYSVGINQVVHRLFINVNTNIQVLVPWSSQDVKINYEILIAENIIVGKVPNTYFSTKEFDTNYIDLIPS